jgi:hypothetical protein
MCHPEDFEIDALSLRGNEGAEGEWNELCDTLLAYQGAVEHQDCPKDLILDGESAHPLEGRQPLC